MKEIVKMFHVLLQILTIAFLAVGCQQPDNQAKQAVAEANSDSLLRHKPDPIGLYGHVNVEAQSLSLAELLQAPEQYEGKTVRIEGVVSAVCPMRGCWIDVAENGQKIRLKVNDGEIVFPLSAAGHFVTATGMVEKIELSKEEAVNWMAHMAEGKPFDSSQVTGPVVIWRLKGVGATIKSQS